MSVPIRHGAVSPSCCRKPSQRMKVHRLGREIKTILVYRRHDYFCRTPSNIPPQTSCRTKAGYKENDQKLAFLLPCLLKCNLNCYCRYCYYFALVCLMSVDTDVHIPLAVCGGDTKARVNFAQSSLLF